MVLGDAYRLPFPDDAFDVSAFITTLEFLEQPDVALTEAIRVSRKGIVLVVLNKWSTGGFLRRWGKQAHGQKLGRVRDYSLPQLVKRLQEAASDHFEKLWWMSALFPIGPLELLGHLPIGDVIGLTVRFGLKSTDVSLSNDCAPASDTLKGLPNDKSAEFEKV